MYKSKPLVIQPTEVNWLVNYVNCVKPGFTSFIAAHSQSVWRDR